MPRSALMFLCFALAGGCAPSEAQVVPDEDRIDWSGVGIPGGIPTYPVAVNVRDFGATGNGTADDTAAIQNAISACPAGRAVLFPAGTYRTTARLTVSRGIALRGEGPARSRILQDSAEGTIVSVGISGGGPGGTPVDLSAGYVKGSTSVTASDVSAFAVGDYVGIYQDNEPGLVFPQGYGANCGWCGFAGDHTTAMAQLARVTGKTGSTLTLSQALYYTFRADLHPRLRKVAVLTGFGLEDIALEKVRNEGESATGSITLFGVAHSWIRNVHSRMCLGAHVRMSYAYGCVIRDSFFDDAFLRTGSRSYGVFLLGTNSANLVENNALYRVTPALCLEAGGSGNVIAYNFTKDSFHDSEPTWFFGSSAITHGAHPYMNLFEGNKLEGLHFDNTWGSSSHNTVFRNHIVRACGQGIYGVRAVDVQQHNYHHSFLANVLGLAGQTGTWGPAQCETNRVMWRFGCLSPGASGEPSDPAVAATTLRHGNFSMIANEAEWDPTIAERSFPDSLYLAARPAFFGDKPWPLYGPGGPAGEVLLPAEERFLAGIGSAPAASIDDAAVTEGHSGASTLTITIRLSKPSATPVTVEYGTSAP